jgi:flagellar hook-associated protein FlgK
LLDHRDTLQKNLSDFAHVNAKYAENGVVTVSLGPSFVRDVVVDAGTALNIGTNYNSASAEKVSLVLDPYGKSQPLTSITSGKLAGMLSFREQVLGSSRDALDTLARSFVQQVNNIQTGGVDAYGNNGTELFKLDPQASNAAGGIQLGFEDPMRIAAAAQFRIAEGPNNTGGAQSKITYQVNDPGGAPSIESVLGNDPSNSKSFVSTPGRPFTAVATIPNGLNNVNVTMRGADGQNLQIFTRDGRQILGSALNADQLNALVNPDNGFSANATPNTQYLNQSGDSGYKDLTVFYGARADVRVQPRWDMNVKDPTAHPVLTPTPMAALLQGGPIPTHPVINPDGTVIAAGALVLNGNSLGALTLAAGQSLQASDISTWINNANVSGVHASATNQLKFTPTQIALGKPLTLNGQTITSGVNSMEELAAAINSNASDLSATIDADGNLQVTNSPGHEGESIVVSGAIPNALGLSNGTYTGQVSITRDLVAGADTPIELGFGPNGTPDDLSKLGLATGTYIKGQPNEDLLVFVTGAGTAQISASYSGSPTDPKQALRQNPLQIRFDTSDRYSVWDTRTNTQVASHAFNAGQLDPGITYQGLSVSFTAPPKAGDVFNMDGNRDGTGNNQNMLDLVDLQKAKVMGGGRTLSEAYIDQVNDMGNVARQASISQSALKVVNEQAINARDQVSGVSMDQEAADLIRFQQAYQASAKVLQVASEVFDSILQVR